MAKGHFAKSESQAASVMKEIQGKLTPEELALGKTRDDKIESKGTVRDYEQALKTCCDYMKEFKLGALRDITPEQAKDYLNIRSTEVSQSTLNMDRQAIQFMMQHVTGQLDKTQPLYDTKNRDPELREKLPVSEKETVEKSRGYTPWQVNEIINRQTELSALSTRICYEAGLRAHELLTLRPIGEVPPSPREAHDQKFTHMRHETVPYTVNGKGGLIREVHLPKHLAEQLESRKFATPQLVMDRKVEYVSHYNIIGGHQFSDSFSKASSRALDYSNGAHGLRHSYAQDRYEQLANYLVRDDVMRVISQELGHFRPDITEVYLR